jgi:NADH-quinone oxidoreductase subunit H
VSALVAVVAIVVGVWLVAALESWVSTGRFRPGRPLAAAAAMLGQESLVPRRPDRILFEIAPPILLAASVAATTVLPLAPDVIVIDLATGGLFVNAAWVYVVVALIMAGWGPDGAYAMVAGWRFLAQLIAYAMLTVMPITAVAMRAESLSTTAIVESQAGDAWNAVTQPLGFVLFWLAAMAVAFLPPFDHPLAPGELAGGVTAEYTGVRLAIFRLGRLVLILNLAVAVVVFFLGGWLGPWLPAWAWTAVKTLTVIAAMLLMGRLVPRLRSEHLLAWSWKLGIPLALINILWVGVTLWGVDR